MAKSTLLLSLVCALSSLHAQSQYPFQNRDLPLEQRVDNILSLMTLDEKLACLDTNSVVPRLTFPMPEVPKASTWDPDLIRRAGAVQGYEARYIYQSPNPA